MLFCFFPTSNFVLQGQTLRKVLLSLRVLKKFLSYILPILLLTPFRAQGQDFERFFFSSDALVRPLYGKVDTVSVVLIGDVMMHSRQIGYPMSHFLLDLKDMLSEADIAVANMEFTLAGPPYSGYPAFSAPDSIATCVAASGVDVFLCANNHIMDKGSKGLERTLEVYSGMEGIRFTGAASNEEQLAGNYPLVLSCKGIRLALINFTYGTNAPRPAAWPKVNCMVEEEVQAAFDRARLLGADAIIAMPHWGTEYTTVPDASQKLWARKLADMGADAVIGCHPHFVQDSCSVSGVPVIYSMGNAVSNMSAWGTRLALAVTLKVVRERTGEVRVLKPQLEFLWCTLPGTLTTGYATVRVRPRIGRRAEWLNPADYDRMISTYRKIKELTGIKSD